MNISAWWPIQVSFTAGCDLNSRASGHELSGPGHSMPLNAHSPNWIKGRTLDRTRSNGTPGRDHQPYGSGGVEVGDEIDDGLGADCTFSLSNSSTDVASMW